MPPINPTYLKDIERRLAESKNRINHVFLTYGKTHKGLVREKNEDALYFDEDNGLWVVADGIGGVKGGELASAAVIDHLRSFKQLENVSKSIRDLEARFLIANSACRVIFEKQVVGSTVAALFHYESLVVFLWAGDSRIYRLREGSLSLMTVDHNLAQERVRRGEVSQENSQSLPSSNVLTRAVGIHHKLRVEMNFAPLQSGDRFLICTDGLYRELAFSKIESLLQNEKVDLALERLIDEALKKGGKDNISGFVIKVS
ncbi:MAG: PP2C family serine/threonine-protein phosphatase [Pseudomonadota bacterium]|nr:PP2C family serine/threonine-protein phosphatase [Pseudomonadota bacterium]